MKYLALIAKDDHSLRVKAQKEKSRYLSHIKQAQKEGVMVCIGDSLRAGNCRVGTESWGQQFGLSPKEHYRPNYLLKLAPKDKRVALVVAQAIRRHRMEMERGYGIVSEHYNKD